MIQIACTFYIPSSLYSKRRLCSNTTARANFSCTIRPLQDKKQSVQQKILLDLTTWLLKFTWSPPHDLSAHVKDFFPITLAYLLNIQVHYPHPNLPTHLQHKLSTSCSCVTPQFTTSAFFPRKKMSPQRIVGASRESPGAVPISETCSRHVRHPPRGGSTCKEVGQQNTKWDVEEKDLLQKVVVETTIL